MRTLAIALTALSVLATPGLAAEKAKLLTAETAVVLVTAPPVVEKNTSPAQDAKRLSDHKAEMRRKWAP